MKRALAAAILLVASVHHHAWSAPTDDTGDEDEDEEDADEDTGSDAKAKPASDDEADADADEDQDEDEEEEDTDEDGLPEKQNLSGRDEGTDKKPSSFEKNRFFVDKVDTEATENKTLIQGSLASSSFFYGERGGDYPNATMAGANGDNAGPKRLFTELRLQTDFRHIKASRWDARVDVRGRFVPQPDNDVSAGAAVATTDNHIQSGLLGENELDLRELWLVRSGKRTDVFLGRQFVPDLGGVKFDGLRVDYAKSAKLTMIGFGGLYPVRGPRSINTDYARLKDENGKSAGRFVGIGGVGAAYRTVSSYGALGAVTEVPFKTAAESARVYLTSNGYLRSGAKLDFYHFALVDVLGSAAKASSSGVQLTNLSAGVNVKPNPRLRLTASFNRVDTETLSVQAGAYLNQPDLTGVGGAIIQSDTYIARIATNTARGGISAGLGNGQRFEVSTAISYRFRPAFTLRPPDPTATTQVDLPEASSVEVWGSFVDRHSIKDARIGIDASKSFAVGQQAYQRSTLLMARIFVNREMAKGRGEWEAEASYSKVEDSILGMNLGCTMVSDCYGTSNNTLFDIGGQLFYRLKADWFAIGTLHITRITNKRSDMVADPTVYGLTGFFRIAKRF
jgi:hypothetical protein